MTITPHPVYAMQWPKLAPMPQSLNLTFEDVPVGMMARRWSLAGATEGATFAVTDEIAAAGQRSLKVTDKAGLGKPFYPYATYRTNVTQGPVALEFDFRQGDAGGEACFEFRDYHEKPAGTFSSGPSLIIKPDGKLTVADKVIAELPAGQWSHIRITFSLGDGAAKEYELTVTLPDGKSTTAKLPFAKADFNVMTDLYIVSNGTTEAAFYIDDLKLQVQE